MTAERPSTDNPGYQQHGVQWEGTCDKCGATFWLKDYYATPCRYCDGIVVVLRRD